MSTPSPARGDRIAGAVVFAFVLLLALAAVVLAAGSLASYASVKAHLDSFASDGDANVTRADFDAIVMRLRIAALAAAIASTVVYAGRKRLRRQLLGLAASVASSLSSLLRSLRVALVQESRLHLGALVLITVIAFLVRLEFLFQPMRYDESVTFVHYASRPWYIALTNYTAPNNHVLHSLLVHVSTLLFGGAPWAIRLPAFIGGLLLVPASYVAARAFYGKHAALAAASLVASSSVLVEYSTNARGYTLLAVVFALLLALATRLSTSWSPAEWLAFAVLGAIGFYLIPTMLYALGAVATWLVLSLWTGDRALILHRLLPAVVLAGVLSLLLYTPIIASSGIDALVANEFVRSLSWSEFTSRWPDSLDSLAKQWNRDIPWPFAVALGAAFLAAIAFTRRLCRYAVPPALAALLWIVPIVLAQRVVPFERVWLFLLPLYLMTASAGLVYALRPLAARVGGETAIVAAVAVVLAASLSGNAVATQAVYDSEETSTFRDGSQAAAFLAERLRPEDKVLVAPPADAILEYWLDRRKLDPATLLYWAQPGRTRRFLVVVKEGPREYPLAHLLADPRLARTHLTPARVLHRFDSTTVYEVSRDD